MLRRMPAKQFLAWQAYASVEPFGQDRADYRAASVVAAIYNVNRDTKKQRKPWPISDFKLQFGDDEEGEVTKGETKPGPKRRQTWQEQKSILMAFAAAHIAKEQKKTRKKR